MNCGILVQEPGSLCPACWKNITFLKAPSCFACGYPFEFDIGSQALCLTCSTKRPPYHRARAAMVYDDYSSHPILSFKHGDRTENSKAFARWLLHSGKDLIQDADYIIPVPLHWKRLFSRRYNQAAMIAVEMGRISGKPVLTQSLIRHKITPSQGQKSRAERIKNVKNAFAISPKSIQMIHEKNILLIDDVMTTGATISACAKTLLSAGVKKVDVLTLARIVRPGQMP